MPLCRFWQLGYTRLFCYERTDNDLKNRTVIGVICAVLAVVLMFAVSPLINKLTAGKVEIVRLAKDIPQGRAITEQDVVTVTVGGYNLPQSIVKDKAAVIGKYAACDLKKDDYLLPSKISATADNADDVFRTLNGSEQAISIPIANLAAGLSGKLKNGDIVTVIAQDKDGTTYIPPELKYVKVITTTTSNGYDKDQLTPNEDGTTDLPSTVTLLANSTQAQLLAGYNKIHLALVYRGEEKTAQQFLDKQKEVFQYE